MGRPAKRDAILGEKMSEVTGLSEASPNGDNTMLFKNCATVNWLNKKYHPALFTLSPSAGFGRTLRIFRVSTVPDRHLCRVSYMVYVRS
jgi:hypothetical protein